MLLTRRPLGRGGDVVGHGDRGGGTGAEVAEGAADGLARQAAGEAAADRSTMSRLSTVSVRLTVSASLTPQLVTLIVKVWPRRRRRHWSVERLGRC